MHSLTALPQHDPAGHGTCTSAAAGQTRTDAEVADDPLAAEGADEDSADPLGAED